MRINIKENKIKQNAKSSNHQTHTRKPNITFKKETCDEEEAPFPTSILGCHIIQERIFSLQPRLLPTKNLNLKKTN